MGFPPQKALWRKPPMSIAGGGPWLPASSVRRCSRPSAAALLPVPARAEGTGIVRRIRRKAYRRGALRVGTGRDVFFVFPAFLDAVRGLRRYEKPIDKSILPCYNTFIL